MSQAQGKAHEKRVRTSLLNSYGQDLEVLRLEDSTDAGHIVSKKPSDYVVIFPDGKSAFLEVKYRSERPNQVSLNVRNLLEESQIQAIKKCKRNGKSYYLVLRLQGDFRTRDYAIPMPDLFDLVNASKPIKLLEMQKWLWNCQTDKLP